MEKTPSNSNCSNPNPNINETVLFSNRIVLSQTHYQKYDDKKEVAPALIKKSKNSEFSNFSGAMNAKGASRDDDEKTEIDKVKESKVGDNWIKDNESQSSGSSTSTLTSKELLLPKKNRMNLNWSLNKQLPFSSKKRLKVAVLKKKKTESENGHHRFIQLFFKCGDCQRNFGDIRVFDKHKKLNCKKDNLTNEQANKKKLLFSYNEDDDESDEDEESDDEEEEEQDRKFEPEKKRKEVVKELKTSTSIIREKEVENNSISKDKNDNNLNEVVFKCKNCNFDCKKKSEMLEHQKIHEKCEKNERVKKISNNLTSSSSPLKSQSSPIRPITPKSSSSTMNVSKSDFEAKRLRSRKIESSTSRITMRRRSSSSTQSVKIHKPKRMTKITNITKNHPDCKPFKCDYCTYKCKQFSSMKLHLRTHTGEKPYRCRYCQYRSTTRGNLKVHERIHFKEKPFKCKFCNCAFSQINSLKKHINSFHPGC